MIVVCEGKAAHAPNISEPMAEPTSNNNNLTGGSDDWEA